jgi:hypothetical protein
MTEAVFNLVTKRKGTNVIRSAPIQFPSTWTPTNDYDAATKIYVDTHGGGSSQQQEHIIYYSKAGPKQGVTADGLTLNSAFGDLSAAIVAANVIAEDRTPCVVHCSDAGKVTVDAVITLHTNVSLYAPDLDLTAVGIELDHNTAVALNTYRGDVSMNSSIPSGAAQFWCGSSLIGNLSSARTSDTHNIGVRTPTFNGNINISSDAANRNWYLDCDYFTGDISVASGCQLFVRSKFMRLLNTEKTIAGTAYIDTDFLIDSNINNILVTGSLCIRSNYSVKSEVPLWFTEIQRAYLSYPMTLGVSSMTFSLSGSDPAVSVEDVPVQIYRMSNFCQVCVGAIYAVAQNGGLYAVSNIALSATFMSTVHDATALVMAIDNGAAVASEAVLNKDDGLIYVRLYGGGNFSGTGSLSIQSFCITVNLP